MNTSQTKGLVVRQQAGFYTVDVGGNEITCKLRGKFKQLRANEDLVAIGDRVLFTLLSDESGVIEEILPRDNAFFRLAPSARGDYKQILIANVNRIFFVFACAEPEPSMRMLDRFLVIGENKKYPRLSLPIKWI